MRAKTCIQGSNPCVSATFLVRLRTNATSIATFKINWEGSKNNYDLVSKTLTPTPGTLEQVPEPATLLLVGIGLVAATSQRRKRG